MPSPVDSTASRTVRNRSSYKSPSLCYCNIAAKGGQQQTYLVREIGQVGRGNFLHDIW